MIAEPISYSLNGNFGLAMEDIKVDDSGWQIPPPNGESKIIDTAPSSPNPYAGRTSPTYAPSSPSYEPTSPTYQPQTPKTPKLLQEDDGFTLVTPEEWNKFKPKSVSSQLDKSEKKLKTSRRAAESKYHQELLEIKLAKDKLAYDKEAIRVAAFRASRDLLCEKPTGLDRPRPAKLTIREITPIESSGDILSEDSENDDEPVLFPSSTRTDKDRRAIKQQRAAKKKSRRGSSSLKNIKSASHFVKPHIRDEPFTKNVSIGLESRPRVSVNDFEPVPRGNGLVIRHKSPGTTNLDNNAGRLIQVAMVKYELVGVKFWGFLKSTLSSTLIPDNFGVSFAGDKILVALPYGLVESIGAFIVGMIPNQETFCCAQKFCRMQIRPIDFETPRDMENAMIYAPYIAMTARAFDREAINRKLSGMLWTKQSLKCLQLGAAASLVMGAMPVAAAATVAGVPVVVGTSLGFAAATACTLAIAAGIKMAHKWFSVDEAPLVYHPSLASSNSQNVSPPQHPKSKIEITLPATNMTRNQQVAMPDSVKENAARVTGLAVDGCEPTVFGTNQHNTIKALEKRSCAERAPFDELDRQEYCDWVVKNWDTLVSKAFKIPVPSDPDIWYAYVAKWVDGCNSSSHAKAKYLAAARSLADQGITAHSVLTEQQLYEWTRREVFVKRETVLKDEDKAPRQVLAPTPEFVVLTAPFIRDLTGIVKRAWRAKKKIVYSPGISSKSLADTATAREWDNKVNSDFDAFDVNQNHQTCAMEVKICQKYHAPTAHVQLMRSSLELHGHSKTGVKFSSPYVRNTGDPWTTLFNSTLTGTLAAYVYCKVRNCHPSDLDMKILVGGDDGLFFYDGTRIDFAYEFGKLGHPATLEHVSDLHKLEFLSCRLTHTSTGWNFIPKVGQAIAKLGYSVRASTPEQARSIARGSAMSMYDSSSGCPPLRLYLDTILRITSGVNAIKPNDEPYKLSGGHTGIATETTWSQLIDNYQYDSRVHELLGKSLSKVTKSGLVIVSPILKMLISVDTGKKEYVYPPPSNGVNDGWIEILSDSEWVRDLTKDGVEPNPGPTHKAQDKRIVVAGLKSFSQRHPDTRMVVYKNPKKQQNKRRGAVVTRIPRKINQYRTTGGHVLAAKFDMAAYKRVLDNPFDLVPVRLGGETMVPSGLATLVTRFSSNITSGGFMSYVLYPIATQQGSTSGFASVTASAPYTYGALTPTLFPGGPSLAALSAEGRIVAAGVRVFTTNNSTADSGLVTIGCVPRDVAISSAVISASGFPIAPASVTATQGWNEFGNYLSTETYPLKMGATAVYRPQDPLDFTFRGLINGVNGLGTVTPGGQLVPFFVVGVNAAGSGAGLFFEFVTHIEYTVGTGAAGIINTGIGNMNSMDSFSVAKSLFGSIYDTTMQGVVGGISSGATLMAQKANQAISNSMDRAAGHFFSSSV